jgi:aryl-alcohol dehydrogenase
VGGSCKLDIMAGQRNIRAAILEEVGGVFQVEDLVLEAPRANEVVVEIAGVGICHTDLKVASGYRPLDVPVVLGHEGAGTVLEIGDDVTSVAVGDSVVISFNSCGRCANCSAGHPAICEQVDLLTFACRRPDDGSSPLRREAEIVHGYFFGQSSFATHAITTERNLAKIDASGHDLALLGPLGCGVQTGAGAVMRVLQPGPGATIAVFGVGTVGLSAVMAAAILGVGEIVAVDQLPARLELATELGATQTIDTSSLGPTPLIDAVREICGRGAEYTIDTTNVPEICRAAFESLCIGGSYAHVGGGGTRLEVDTSVLLAGRTIQGVLQGDSVPAEFIPELLELHRDGRFPFDRLITEYGLDDINDAVSDMRDGTTIKPVLRMVGGGVGGECGSAH